jgi:hypothetical protein
MLKRSTLFLSLHKKQLSQINLTNPRIAIPTL